MMKILRFVVLSVIALAPGALFAASAGTAVPTSMEIDTYDKLVAVNGSYSNPDGCGLTGVVILLMSNANYTDILATILTAGSTQKKLYFWVSGCTYTPWGGTAEVIQDVTITF